jgi:hypothetical protein
MAKDDENRDRLLPGPGEDPEKRRHRQRKTREERGRRKEGTVSSKEDQPRAPRMSSDVIKERRPPREIRSKRRRSSSRHAPPSSTDRGALSSHAQRDHSKPHPPRAAREKEPCDHPGDEEERRRGNHNNDRLSKQGFVEAISVRGISITKNKTDDDPEYDEDVRIAIASIFAIIIIFYCNPST